jgi:enoyl-CoA hydratase/carnithine racemase
MAAVEYEKNNHIVTIIMNRPECYNAFDYNMTLGLAESWTRFEADDDAWVAIVTGAGKAFSAGLDIRNVSVEELQKAKRADLPRVPVADPFWEDKFEKPVIAAVNGYAFGAGFLLALRADLRVASEDALFQLSEVAVGLPVGVWPPEWCLVRENLPYVVTAELLVGMTLNAGRAFQLGFVNEVAPPDQLLVAAKAMAERLISVPPLAPYYNLKLLRRLRRAQIFLPPDIEKEGEENYQTAKNSYDFQEAVRSFQEKRTPSYQRR